MSLADKFAGFTVKQTDRISADDKNFCETLQSVTNRTLSVYHAWYDCYLKEEEIYEAREIEHGTFREFRVSDFGVLKAAEELHKNFRAKIFSYFRTTYHVETIKDDDDYDFGFYEVEKTCGQHIGWYNRKKLVKDRLWEKVNYQKVVDDIIAKLGGMSFTELAIKEVKDELHDTVYHERSWKDTNWTISVKGNTIKYQDGYGYLEQRWNAADGWEYHNPSYLRAFLKAYSMMLYGKVYHTLPGLEMFYKYTVYLSCDDFSNGLVPTCGGNIIEKIKIFKNGRVDIKFQTAEQARDFAREWMGYTLV